MGPGHKPRADGRPMYSACKTVSNLVRAERARGSTVGAAGRDTGTIRRDRMAKVRLEDVARHAGVSAKTVSNVVRDFPHVSVKMREKVQRSIDELGYRPNAMGRGLATGRTGLLAIAFSDVTIPYFAEMARTLSVDASRRGYRLLLEQTDGQLEEERAIVSASEGGL